MLDGIIHHAALLKRLDELGKTRRLVGPVARHVPECDPPVRYFYETVTRAEDLALDFTYCVYGPKQALLPARETLFRFDQSSGHFQATPHFDDRPLALFGIRPCDLHGIRLLDAVFERDYHDEHYQARRRNTLIIGLDCATPCGSDAFCGDMGTNHAESGFDVMLYPLGGGEDAYQAGAEIPAQREYGVVFGTDAGRVWLSADADNELRRPTAADERRYAEYLERKANAFPRKLKARREEIPALLERSYDSLLWDGTAQRCYSCGSCNLVCPTCYCFDIHDENDLPPETGCREREWDGCMLRDFALVAGDHNFRTKTAQRLRHRIYRKGAWIEQRTGLAGCVGCARCDRACTAKISIVEMLNQLAEEAEHAHH